MTKMKWWQHGMVEMPWLGINRLLDLCAGLPWPSRSPRAVSEAGLYLKLQLRCQDMVSMRCQRKGLTSWKLIKSYFRSLEIPYSLWKHEMWRVDFRGCFFGETCCQTLIPLWMGCAFHFICRKKGQFKDLHVILSSQQQSIPVSGTW